jgi:hypothetical protein
MKRSLLSALTAVALASPALAEGKGDKKPKGHCEKAGDNGSVEDVEATDKADCKAKGGKWNKAGKGDHAHDKHE